MNYFKVNLAGSNPLSKEKKNEVRNAGFEPASGRHTYLLILYLLSPYID